jgi:hypothetical protein
MPVSRAKGGAVDDVRIEMRDDFFGFLFTEHYGRNTESILQGDIVFERDAFQFVRGRDQIAFLFEFNRPFIGQGIFSLSKNSILFLAMRQFALVDHCWRMPAPQRPVAPEPR